jgi:hypothetical protein
MGCLSLPGNPGAISVSRSSRTPIEGSRPGGIFVERASDLRNWHPCGFGPSSNFMSKAGLPKRKRGAVKSLKDNKFYIGCIDIYTTYLLFG